MTGWLKLAGLGTAAVIVAALGAVWWVAHAITDAIRRAWMY